MSQITTHILDTAKGKPAGGVALTLFRRLGDDRDASWENMGSGTTNEDGRVGNLLAEGTLLGAGIYRMHFALEGYFADLGEPEFYPYVDVVFRLSAGGEHYHIPLLLSPFGYSTYRGS
ncbi:MAG: 5-hydroxyisourate hydrolase [Halieaceae bacterium]|jgi:5-hydroxyisourate hydrolase